MFIYILLLGFALYNCTLDYNKQKKYSVFLLMLMMIVCGLRASTVGSDTENYITEGLSSYRNERFSIIYYYIKLFANYIWDSPNSYLMCLSILCYVPLCYVVIHDNKNCAIGVLIYMIASSGYFLETFNICRESISLSYALLCLYSFKIKNYKGCVIFAVIGFLFHNYFVLFILFFGVCLLMQKVNISRTVIIISVCISAFVGFSGVLDRLMDFLSFIYESTSSDSMLNVYGMYSLKNNLESGWNQIGMLVTIFPSSIVCVLVADKSNKDINYKLFWIGTLLLNCLVSVRYCERICAFMTIAQVAVISTFWENDNKRFNKIAIISTYVFFYVFYLYRISEIPYSPVPYKFFFY